MKKTVLIFLVCISVFLQGCMTVPYVIHAKIFDRYGDETFTVSWGGEYPFEEVSFYSGKNRLQGFIFGKENDKGLIIFSIGHNSHAGGYRRIITFFVDEGWQVFTFNYTGVAGSEGSSLRGLSQGVIDLDAAISYIQNTGDFDDMPVVLVGFSMGGHAVTANLLFNHKVNAAVSICSFNKVNDVLKYQLKDAAGPFGYLVYPQSLLLQKILFKDLAKLTAVDGINSVHIPVLIMENAYDDFLPPNVVGLHAYKDSITNPFVEFIYLEDENDKGHGLPDTAKFTMIKLFLERTFPQTKD